MLKITVFALVIGLMWAFPQQDTQQDTQPHNQAPVEIIKQDSDVNIDGYNFDFETSDGTFRQEQGDYKNDTEQQGLLVRGSYQYIAPDGQKISVSFIADKNGYQPTVGDDQQKPAQS